MKKSSSLRRNHKKKRNQLVQYRIDAYWYRDSLKIDITIKNTNCVIFPGQTKLTLELDNSIFQKIQNPRICYHFNCELKRSYFKHFQAITMPLYLNVWFRKHDEDWSCCLKKRILNSRNKKNTINFKSYFERVGTRYINTVFLI